MPGFKPKQVRRRFARAFRIVDAARAEAFFSGREVTLRRNLSKPDVAQAFAALRKIGMVTHIVNSADVAVSAPEQITIEAAATNQTAPATQTLLVEEPAKLSPGLEPEPESEPASALNTEPAPEAPVSLANVVHAAKPVSRVSAVAAFAAHESASKTAAPVALAEVPKQARPAPSAQRQPGAPNLFGLRRSTGTRLPVGARAGTINTARVPLIAAAMALLALILAAVRFEQTAGGETITGDISQIAVAADQQLLIEAGGQLVLHNRAGLPTTEFASDQLGIGVGASLAYLSTDVLLAQTRNAQVTDNATTLPVLRCQLSKQQCEPLLNDIGRSQFIMAKEHIYLADVDRNQLHKYSQSGQPIASAALELTAPLELRLQEGILHLIQTGAETVTIITPDDQGFGSVLDSIKLDGGDTLGTGHRYPRDMVYLNERWWTILQNEEASSAGLYLFNLRFRLDRRVPLPTGVLPTSLAVWNDKVLIQDSGTGRVLRYDDAGNALKDFTSDALVTHIADISRQRTLTHWLQILVLFSLVLLVAGFLTLAGLQSLRVRVFTPPEQASEARLDVHSEFITWLKPSPDLRNRVLKLGYLLTGITLLCVIMAIIADVSTASVISALILLLGSAGLYHSLIRATRCHLGLVRDHLILVDHNNTYRVGSGPRIQYLGNFVMVDDVIVYLGNRVLAPFANTPLQQLFQPLFATGIKVDQATLHVKLVQQRHPLVLGLAGFVLCGITAVVITVLG